MSKEVNLVKVGYGHYRLGDCDLRFLRNARYSRFDGKYHPGWVVTVPGVGSFEAVDKKHAITIASEHR